MLKITGVGHNLEISKPKAKLSSNDQKMLLIRRWRLGDIIMCEPVNRFWARQGYEISFCSLNQYHPVIKSFIEHPPKTMTYTTDKKGGLMNPGYKTDKEVNLDNVDLVHSGAISKVEAFLKAGDIDTADAQYSRPQIDVSPTYASWAKIMLADMGIDINQPLIAIIKQSFAPNSPRSLPDVILDEIYSNLAKDYKVLIIGERPVKINVESNNIQNLTGCTPDIMSVAGLLSICQLLITVDTGLMHLAGAISVPMVSILGPTRPDDISSFYEYNSILDVGRECSPCFDRGCDASCLRSVQAQEVTNLARERLSAPFLPTYISNQSRL